MRKQARRAHSRARTNRSRHLILSSDEPSARDETRSKTKAGTAPVAQRSSASKTKLEASHSTPHSHQHQHRAHSLSQHTQGQHAVAAVARSRPSHWRARGEKEHDWERGLLQRPFGGLGQDRVVIAQQRHQRTSLTLLCLSVFLRIELQDVFCSCARASQHRPRGSHGRR